MSETPRPFRVPFAEVPVGARFRFASCNYVKSDDSRGVAPGGVYSVFFPYLEVIPIDSPPIGG